MIETFLKTNNMPRSKKPNNTGILEWDGGESDSITNSIAAWRPGTMFSIPPSVIDTLLPPAHKKNAKLKFVVTEIVKHHTDEDKHKIKAAILDKEKNPTKEYIEFNYKSGLSIASNYHGNIFM